VVRDVPLITLALKEIEKKVQGCSDYATIVCGVGGRSGTILREGSARKGPVDDLGCSATGTSRGGRNGNGSGRALLEPSVTRRAQQQRGRRKASDSEQLSRAINAASSLAGLRQVCAVDISVSV
jgi:hypothetical protein